MNCKPGDLAIYVESHTPDSFEMVVVVVEGFLWCGEQAWFVSPPLTPCPGLDHKSAFDRALRPIRPGDMSDETPTEVIKRLTEPA